MVASRQERPAGIQQLTQKKKVIFSAVSNELSRDLA